MESRSGTSSKVLYLLSKAFELKEISIFLFKIPNRFLKKGFHKLFYKLFADLVVKKKITSTTLKEFA